MIPKESLAAFKQTLLNGEYNLLFGSGISTESKNGKGELLPSSEKLRQELCKLKGTKEDTTLLRVYSHLTAQERRSELTDRFSNCQPARSLTSLPQFIWRRLFTFNIDDVLEGLYKNHRGAKQTLVPLNFNSAFEPTPDRKELQAIHLHGSVLLPEIGYVFSYTEYARMMAANNPWMHLLSEILSTESFIIAGTSLNEGDLEYYLSYRNDCTPRRGRGPSLLIEPYPDATTEADCYRHGLILVKTTFGNFLTWLKDEFPNPPTLSELMIPDVKGIFPDNSLSPQKLLRFFSDFTVLNAGDQPQSQLPSSFLYGREPQQSDLDQHLDIPRIDAGIIYSDVQEAISKKDVEPRVVLVLDEAGTGKSTIIRRVGHDLARGGQIVMSVQTLSRIDSANAAECFAAATSPVVLLVDSLADHVEQIFELVQDERTKGNLVILAAERSYRQEYIGAVFGDTPYHCSSMQPLNQSERRQLIELFRKFGLVGKPRAISAPASFANYIKGDAIAIAVCKILNDFRPLDDIVESLWKATPQNYRIPYLCAAIAHYCYDAGLRYSVLQSISGLQTSLSTLFTSNAPLRLTDNVNDPYYVLPMNAIIGERILQRAIRKDKSTLLDAFMGIASGISPYINRRAIMSRSPEARLAGRLFDVDKVVKPMLKSDSQLFFLECQKEWEWNSRYWEQRALLAADDNLETALQYARHAIAIESHPFAFTTFGKLLLRQMEGDMVNRDSIFSEAFDKLSEAIQKEEGRSRIRIHPYSSLFIGTDRFIALGGSLSTAQRATLMTHMKDAREYFGTDKSLKELLDRLDGLL